MLSPRFFYPLRRRVKRAPLVPLLARRLSPEEFAALLVGYRRETIDMWQILRAFRRAPPGTLTIWAQIAALAPAHDPLGGPFCEREGSIEWVDNLRWRDPLHCST